MKKLQTKTKMTLLSSAIAMALAGVSIQLVQANTSNRVSLGSSAMSYSSLDGKSHVQLSVSGPAMDVISVNNTGGINWELPANAADGLYRYELKTTVPKAEGTDADATIKSQRVHGTFEVINGVIDDSPKLNTLDQEEGGDGSGDLGNSASSLFKTMAISVLDFIVPTAEAANLTADSSFPAVYWNQSGVLKWGVLSGGYGGASDGAMGLFSYVDSQYVLSFKLGSPFHMVSTPTDFKINTATSGSTGIDGISPTFLSINANATNAFIADSNGDVGLANNSVFIDNSTNRLGIGTTTPSQALHVGGTGIIRQDGYSSEYWDHNTTDDYVFNFNNGTTHKIMTVENDNAACGGASGAEVAPCIGFFEPSNPFASVHIKKSDGHTRLLVEEGNSTTAQRFQLELKNNGAAGFMLTDSSRPIGGQWQFASQPNGAFATSLIGTGGPEFQIGADGAVQMGPGAAVNFALNANGNLHILNGSVYATTHVSTSSREVKKDFEAVNSGEVLNKIKNLEVTEWRYKDEDAKGRHIGPMAEDFYRLFELGPDNKHVAATDMASIALIAAKELQKKSDLLTSGAHSIKEETARLKAENAVLKQRMESLEQLVTSLASADGSLDDSGKKIALIK